MDEDQDRMSEEEEEEDYDYGIQTNYTKSEFDEYIAKQDLNCQCELRDHGTVYFVYYKKSGFSDYPEERQIHAVYYDEQKGIMHKSDDFLANASTPFKAFAIDLDSYVLANRESCFLCILNENWSLAYVTEIDPGGRVELAEFLSDETSVNRDGLSNIRRDCPPDFNIKCAGGESIGVHKAVLSSTWPFFKAMLETNMKEASVNLLELDQPETTVEAMVKYLYGEKQFLLTEDAARLLVVAQMYELPELLELAEESLKDDVYCDGGFEFWEALLIWRKAYEAENNHLREFAANEIKNQMPGMDDFAEQVDELSKEELMFLMQDVSVCMGKKRMHV